MRCPFVTFFLIFVFQAVAVPVRMWTFTNDLQGWRPSNWESSSVEANGFSGISKYDCQLLSPKLGIEAREYPELLVRMTTDLGGGGETFFASAGKGLSDKRKARHLVVASPEARLYRIRLQGQPGWEGVVDHIRFDPLNPAGAKVHIDFIALMPRAGMSPVNGGMEVVHGGKLLDWSATGAGATIIHESPHEGNNALRLQAGSSWGLEPIDLSLLGRYRVEGFARVAKGGAGQLSLHASFSAFSSAEKLPGSTIPLPLRATGEWIPFRAVFSCPRKAHSGHISFTAENGVVDLDDVYLTRFAAGDIVDPGPPRPQWNAAWIWHPDALELDHQTVYFRYKFNLPQKRIRRAQIQVTADDSYALSLNGKSMEQQFGVPDGWRIPELIDIAPALQVGENLVAVEARDAASAQGFIAEGLITFADGSEMPLRSGADWLVSRQPGGPWVPSHELGTPPCLPWRDLPGVELADPVPVRGTLQPLPKVVESPNRLPVTLDLSLRRDCRRPVFVQAKLMDGEQLLADAWASRPAFKAGAKAGAECTLDWQLTVPYGVVAERARVSFHIVGGVFDPPLAKASVQLRGQVAETDFPRAECRVVDGVPRLFVNGTEIDPTQAFFIRPDQIQQGNAREGRIPILCVGLQEIGFMEKGFDYSNVDSLLSSYLGACPEAWIIPNFTFGTRYQSWWIKAHPEARCRLEDGSDVIGDYHGNSRIVPSFASPVWREAYGDALRRLIRHLKKSPFASRIIGFHPCSGITTEWFHWGAQSGDLVDYSKPGQEDFRRWLRLKYGTDEALQTAWNRGTVSLATVAIPSGERRRSPKLGIFFDPQSQQDVVDYNRYQHDNVAESISYFARIIKEETRERSLVGTYYGYVSHLPETVGFCQSSGHFSLRRLLDNPDIDFLMAPLAYGWREVGNSGAGMSATASHALNGKLWWHQEDLRTHWVRPSTHGASQTLAETVDVFRRELARNLAQGTAIQWYDFSKGWIFGDDRVSREVGRIRELDEYRKQGKEWPLSNYLAVIIDEKQMGTFDLFRPPYGGDLIHRQRNYLNRAGIPWKCYLFSDLRKHPRLLEHRAFLFLNLFRLNAEQRRFLRETVMRDNRTVAFVGPAGIIGDKGIDPRASAELTGLDMVRLADDAALASTFGDALSAPWAELSGMEFKVRTSYPPLLAPQRSKGTLALFAGSSAAAVVAEQRREHRLFWSGIPGLRPEVLRGLARFAELPVLSSSDDAVYFGHGFCALHAKTDGERTITLPEAAFVRELFTGQTWPAGTRTITVNLRRGQTLLLHCVR